MRTRISGVLASALAAVLTAAPGSAAAVAATAVRALPWTVPGPRDGGLASISCASTSMCMGVGSVDGPAAIAPVAARFDGQQWSYQKLNVPGGYDGASLNDLSCPTANWCIAVGQLPDAANGDGLPWTDAYSGGRWTPSALPHPSGQITGIAGISCPATGQCIAVGSSYDRHDVFHPLIERLLNGAWSLDTWAGGGATILRAVSCATVSSCVAVGENGGHPTAAVLRNGQWTASPLTPPSGQSFEFFTGLDCVTATACTAIGVGFAGNSYHPMAAVLGSGRWSMSALPEPMDAGGLTGQISCIHADACVAVQSGTAAPHVETMKGGVWTAALLPVPTGLNGRVSMSALSCPGSARCVAVGASQADTDTGFAETFPPAAGRRRRSPSPTLPTPAWSTFHARRRATALAWERLVRPLTRRLRWSRRAGAAAGTRPSCRTPRK